MIKYDLYENVFDSKQCDEILNHALNTFRDGKTSDKPKTDYIGTWEVKTCVEDDYIEYIRSLLVSVAIPSGYKIRWINLTTYKEGVHLNPHRDEDSSRTLICPLNDNYEGGLFTLEKLKFKLSKGSVLAFDGGAVNHGVTHVTKGTRYSMNLWLIPTKISII